MRARILPRPRVERGGRQLPLPQWEQLRELYRKKFLPLLSKYDIRLDGVGGELDRYFRLSAQGPDMRVPFVLDAHRPLDVVSVEAFLRRLPQTVRCARFLLEMSKGRTDVPAAEIAKTTRVMLPRGIPGAELDHLLVAEFLAAKNVRVV